MEQINLALLFGEQSSLPFYYRKLPGNISDVKTVKNLLADLEDLGCQEVKLVMDRGFASIENINALYQNHLKFIISPRMNLRVIAKGKASVAGCFRDWEHYNVNYDLFAHSRSIKWAYSQDRPYKGDDWKRRKDPYHPHYGANRQFNKSLSGVCSQRAFSERKAAVL